MTAWGKASGLARRFDLAYAPHRLLAVVALLVAILGGLWSTAVVGVDPRAAVAAPAATAVASGVSALMAWALGRELDPDHPLAAIGAAALALPVMVLVGFPAWLAAFGLLLAMRALNGSTGRSPTLVDYVVLAALVGGLAYSGWGDAAAGVVAVLVVASAMANRGPRHWFGTGLGAVAAVVLARPGLAGQLPRPPPPFSYNPRLPLSLVDQISSSGALGPGAAASVAAPGVDPLAVAAAAAVILLFLPAVAGARRLGSVDDASGAPLSGRRVVAGQAAAVLVALALVVRHGGAGLAALGVLWAAMAALGVAAVIRGARSGLTAVR